jgi:signal transduction histidine kinase
MGSLEMLEMEELDEDQRNTYIEKIRGQAQRIDRLFRDLVTLQRYDSDKYFVEKKVFDLGELCTKIRRWHEDRAKEKGLDLKVKQVEQQVVGDPDKIGQVLDNLVSNAVKYTNAGEVVVNYERIDDEKVVEIAVRDTGSGIDPEHRQRLFDRFYRTDKARSRDRGGTGLGLAVVKSILDAHDTDIHLETEKGKGTTFRFRLPAG